MSLGITLVPLDACHVEVAGPLASGPLAYHDLRPEPGVAERGTVVFVPGYTGSKEDFALLAKAVTDTGFRYVSLDQRGQYESPGPDDPAAYGVDPLAGDLLAFLAALGLDRVHLVGHSFGGLVARAMTIAAPERVVSLALLGSGPAGLAGPRVDRMRLLEPVLEQFGPEAVFEAMLAAAPVPPGETLAAFLKERFLRSSLAGLRGIGEAVTSEPDRVAELRATGVRTLVACGKRDDAWDPEVQRDMAERLGAPFRVIRDAVHSPAAEAPGETVRVLTEFWLGG